MDHTVDEVIMSDQFNIFRDPPPPPRNPRIYIDRDCSDSHNRLFNDYFARHPLYTPQIFRRRFCMRKHVFCRIMNSLTTNDDFFPQKIDAAGRFGASPLQKCTAAIRLLATRMSPDSLDDIYKISGALSRQSLHHFVEGVISQFGAAYLRKLTDEDLPRLKYEGEKRGFPGMLGSIDCMHWEWRNCPARWRGQFQGRYKKPTMVLEVVASYDLWIWHAFFGTPGSCNDINVLDRSPLFNDIFEVKAPSINFTVNGNAYDMGYYLTDGIYPPWAAFIQSIRVPVTRKQTLFAQVQEGVRKDVERAFGVLQGRWSILRNPTLAHDKAMLGKIMMACIIMHNMIIEDERDTYQNYTDPTKFLNDIPPEANSSTPWTNSEPAQASTERVASLSNYMVNRGRVRD